MPVDNGKLKLTTNASELEALLELIPDHSSRHEASGLDPIKIDRLATPDDTTELNVSTIAHGLVPKLPNDATKFFNGVGEYTVPAGSGGVEFGTAAGTACEGNDSRLSDTRNPNSHAAAHKDSGTDPIKLDELADPDDNTTLNATASRHGLCPKLSGVANEYLNGAGGFSIPPLASITFTGVPGMYLTAAGTFKIPLLSELAAPTANENTNLLATINYPGLMPKLNGNGATVLAGNGRWVSLPTTESPLPPDDSNVISVGPAGSGADYIVDGTEDHDQINSAIASAVAGDTVYLMAHKYDIMDTIIMKSGITLKGQGIINTILNVKPENADEFAYGDAAIIELNTLNNVDIHSLKIDGGDGAHANCGNGWENAIQVHRGGSNLTIHDVHITRINGDGIRVTPVSTSNIHKNANIYNFKVTRSGHDAIKGQHTNNWKIWNMYCEIYINYGIRFWESTNCSVSYSTFFATEGSGNAAIGFDGSCPGLNIHHNRFQDIWSNDGNRFGIYATLGTGAVTISNNIFYKCYQGGIKVDAAANETFNVSQNIFDTCAYAFDNLNGTFTDNIITNCTSYAADGESSALCTMEDNIIYGGQTGVTNATVTGTVAEDPVYNATSLKFVPLQSSSPMYATLAAWTEAGYK